ncbi:MAG: deoxyribodipyrimidine photo-lyase [Anaerolineales bacterium]|nr:deoxyribodipyrimidine photo-lyase [Anaerolineales bacterium]
MNTVIWWIRRDLRLFDNPTLQTALEQGAVVPLFIIDPQLYSSVSDRRRHFLLNGLKALDHDLRARGSLLILKNGPPEKILHKIFYASHAVNIYAEEDYTPYARQRDNKVAHSLPLKLVQGQLVHHPMTIRKPDGTPYTVFTPFSKTWKALLPAGLKTLPAPAEIPFPEIKLPSDPFPSAESDPGFPAGEQQALQRLQAFTAAPCAPALYEYASGRDRLDQEGTSGLSPYFHFGILSVRQAVAAARQASTAAAAPGQHAGAEVWINELIWREFYISILYYFPRVLRGNFRKQYDGIVWSNDQEHFQAWKQGETGYPIVDAAMRQLEMTGWMHNRARMITASFLVKDLLIDWRWGESWFLQNLLDADLAANNGGWQWTAGTGTDAAPYFRIFNPVLQSRKFDPQGDYIRRWLPELAHLPSKTIHTPWQTGSTVSGYPAPIVDHKAAREHTLHAFKTARNEQRRHNDRSI